MVEEECNELKIIKEHELEQLDKIAKRQMKANQLMKEKTQAKNMKMFMNLSEKEHLDNKNKQLLERLSHDLFEIKLMSCFCCLSLYALIMCFSFFGYVSLSFLL